jgi:hypothetical protein
MGALPLASLVPRTLCVQPCRCFAFYANKPIVSVNRRTPRAFRCSSSRVRRRRSELFEGKTLWTTKSVSLRNCKTETKLFSCQDIVSSAHCHHHAYHAFYNADDPCCFALQSSMVQNMLLPNFRAGRRISLRPTWCVSLYTTVRSA